MTDEGRKSPSWMPHGHTSEEMLAYEAAKERHPILASVPSADFVAPEGALVPFAPGTLIVERYVGPAVVERKPSPTDVCPTCAAGRLDAKGVASLPSECCAIYFFGAGSVAHGMWKDVEQCLRNTAHRPAPKESEKDLRTRLSGLGRGALIELLVEALLRG